MRQTHVVNLIWPPIIQPSAPDNSVSLLKRVLGTWNVEYSYRLGPPMHASPVWSKNSENWQRGGDNKQKRKFMRSKASRSRRGGWRRPFLAVGSGEAELLCYV